MWAFGIKIDPQELRQRIGVNRIGFHFRSTNRFHATGVGQVEGHRQGAAQIGEPIPRRRRFHDTASCRVSLGNCAK